MAKVCNQDGEETFPGTRGNDRIAPIPAGRGAAIQRQGSTEDRGRDAHCWTPTGWAEAVACLRLPQNVACRFPALRSSGAGSQHYESLQRPVGQPQSWSEQRDPLLEPSEGGPGKVAACPAAATEHLPPVTLDEPVHPLQRADVSGDTIIGVVPAEGEIKRVDLFLDRQVSYLPHLVAQRHQAAPQA